MRSLTRMLGLVGFALALAVSSSGAQSRALRFEVETVGDSTFVFLVGNQPWVRSALAGVVVDPRQRDALVARFRVIEVRDGQATALVTGQTTDVVTEHMALLEQPEQSWFVRRTFWGGMLLGLAAGIGAGLAMP